MDKVIVNSTPVIGLADIGKLDLLRQMYGTVILPQAVYEEITSPSVKKQVEQNRAWIHIGQIQDLAQEQDADLVILDDNAAKKTAKFLGLHVIGTLGILVLAKRKGYIEKVGSVLDALKQDGFFVGEDVCQLVLRQADEK